jgi:hypothetical protein
VIEYLSKNDFHTLWTTQVPKRDPRVARQLFEKRQAAEKRKQERIAEWRKHKKEEQTKELANESRKAKPSMTFATPGKATWTELSDVPTPATTQPLVSLKTSTSIPSTGKAVKRNRFVWKCTDDQHSIPVPDIQLSSPRKEESHSESSNSTQETCLDSVNHFVWRCPDITEPKSELELELEFIPSNENQSLALNETVENPMSDSEKQQPTDRIQLTISDEVSISIPEEEFDDLVLTGKLENQAQSNESMLHTMMMTTKEMFCPSPLPHVRGYWAVDPRFGIPVFVRQYTVIIIAEHCDL